MSSQSKLKIAFVWDWNPEYSQAITWMDGLAAALKELINRGHEVGVFLPGVENNLIKHPYFDMIVAKDLPVVIHTWNPDVILHWGDMTRPNAVPLRELNKPMAICFAGGEPLNYNTGYFEHIFVESEVYRKVFEDAGYSTSIAFGTNTELFTPIKQNKVFDTIFPATFAAWKHHEIYARAVSGRPSLAVGYMYPDHEQECWQVCIDNGVTVLPHVSAEALHYLYASSRVCVITSASNGGSQRTVLEAMAMNLPLIVTDSDKFDYARGRVFECDPNPEAVRGFVGALADGDTEVSTRQYIIENWSEYTYADSLIAGLRSIV